jgi:hypothetical protein
MSIDRDLADPGTAQSEREGAARLAAADNHDVVVDGMVRHPVLRIRADQPQRLARGRIRIGRFGHPVLP